jgi:hypothetical protein
MRDEKRTNEFEKTWAHFLFLAVILKFTSWNCQQMALKKVKSFHEQFRQCDSKITSLHSKNLISRLGCRECTIPFTSHPSHSLTLLHSLIPIHHFTIVKIKICLKRISCTWLNYNHQIYRRIKLHKFLPQPFAIKKVPSLLTYIAIFLSVHACNFSRVRGKVLIES